MLVLLGNSLAPTLRDYFKAQIEEMDGFDRLPASFGKFSAGQAFTHILGNAVGQDVVLIQSLGSVDDHSTNDFATQTEEAVAELKRPVEEGGSGVRSVWVIEPYSGYGRQDRKVNGENVSLGMETHAQKLKALGADGFSTIGLHSQQGLEGIQKYFGLTNVFNLSTAPLVVDYARRNLNVKKLRGGSPDAGGRERARAVTHPLRLKMFEFDKRRTSVNGTEVKRFHGRVRGFETLTIDDEIDTAGTADNSQKELKKRGATRRIYYADHAVLSGGGLERAFTSGARGDRTFDKIIFTDTIDSTLLRDRLKRQYDDIDDVTRVEVLSVGPLLWDHIVNDIANHPAIKADLG